MEWCQAVGVWSGCTFKWEQKNKINKSTQGRQYHAVAHNKNMHLKNLNVHILWAPAACTQASALLPLHTQTQTHALSRELRVTVLISWLVNYHMKAGFLTACNIILSILSSYLHIEKKKNLPSATCGPHHHPQNPVGSNWPGVLHNKERCWELDRAC